MKIEKQKEEKECLDNTFVLKTKEELYIDINLIVNREKLINISLFNVSLFKLLKIPQNLYNKTTHNLISSKTINEKNCMKIMDSLVIVLNQINVFLIYNF